MDIFLKATASILVSLILALVFGKQGQEMSALLAIAICCMTGMIALQMLQPLLDFLYFLQSLTGMDDALFRIMFKSLGISLICEISSTVCADAGFSSFGKSLQLLGSAVILYISIPLLQSFITLVQEIMGGI